MPGFWYPTAIAAVTSVFVGLASSLSTGEMGKVKLANQKPIYSATAVSEVSIDLVANQPDQQQFQQAQKLANQAVKAFQSARQDAKSSLAYTRRERDLWQAALTSLASIPQNSALHSSAIAKQTQYQQLLATAESKIAKADSAFLPQIIKDAGVRPRKVHVTLCQIDNPTANIHSGPLKLLNPTHSSITAKTQVKSQINSQQCRHHQGDELLASPASLIKLPIAIALLQKAEAEGIDLNQKIKLDSGNFTENAEGAMLQVGQSYSLGEIMAHMIDRSDNIATNQLIDYIGRDRLTPLLEEMGYVDTYAGHKLAGNRVMPKDMGDRRNQTTTNDLTAMLVRTYSLQAPGEQALLQALQNQTDQELAHQALQDRNVQSSGVQWLGEKTGQNQQVIGSTMAMQVGTERYALTVAIDHSGDVQALREIVAGVADYLQNQESLIVRHTSPPPADFTIAHLD